MQLYKKIKYIANIVPFSIHAILSTDHLIPQITTHAHNTMWQASFHQHKFGS